MKRTLEQVEAARSDACQRQRGQALVEFMLVMPVILLITLGIIEFSRILFNV